MSQSPSLINSDTEIDWPLEMPDAPDLIETHASPMELEPEPRNWLDILDEQDKRLPVIRREHRQSAFQHLYEHLPNSIIDWELEGKHVCRVKDIACYGQYHKNPSDLRRHLSSQNHLEHEASLAQRNETLSASKRTMDVPVSPSPAKKVRLKHTIERTTGDDLVLKDKPFEEAETMPQSFYYPPWLVIPDSQDTSENELLPPTPEKERLKHTIENTVGENLTLELKSFEEAAAMPLSFYYPPWGEIPDSQYTSADELLEFGQELVQTESNQELELKLGFLNIAHEGRRVVLTSVGVPLANLMGLVSSNIFRENEKPKYPTALITTACFGACGCLIAGLLGGFMVFDNMRRNRRAGRKTTAADVPTTRLRDGPAVPEFRWFL
ncbi:hypothetical protein FBULB1_2840 [Fusarium bulbicola]|nr:hypothetical protein FBULB1_2840 [Fusarium bulbicola]